MNRIKELRLNAGLTQKELANKLGCNQTAVGKYEREELEPNLDTLKKLSSIFECSVDYLISKEYNFCVIHNSSKDSSAEVKSAIFIERLKDLMIENNLNFNTLAKQTLIPVTTLSNYLNRGSLPSVTQLSILADFFKCSIDYLIGRGENKEFSVIFRSLRKEFNYNQNDIAEKIGVTRSTISDWETQRSEPNIAQLRKTADLFNCSIDYLVGRESNFSVILSSNKAHSLTSLDIELLTHLKKLTESQKNRLIGYAYSMINQEEKL